MGLMILFKVGVDPWLTDEFVSGLLTELLKSARRQLSFDKIISSPFYF
jgi:hypothetical protein